MGEELREGMQEQKSTRERDGTKRMSDGMYKQRVFKDGHKCHKKAQVGAYESGHAEGHRKRHDTARIGDAPAW